LRHRALKVVFASYLFRFKELDRLRQVFGHGALADNALRSASLRTSAATTANPYYHTAIIKSGRAAMHNPVISADLSVLLAKSVIISLFL
jgi:hypothetical protein